MLSNTVLPTAMPPALRHRLRSSRSSAVYVSRLTATATFAYLLALVIPAGTSRPVLAPLTALLVLQASLYQTIHSAVRKVLSVTAGVLVAVGVAEFIGFSWWQLTLVIAGALSVGRVLRLGDDILEVPISAMLIFSSIGHQAAAAGRVVDTLVGSAAGLAGGLVFAGGPQVRPARSAVGHLAGEVAGLLDRMAADLRGPGADLTEEASSWLTQSRELRDEIERVDDALRAAADSARLNPRAVLPHGDGVLVSETTVALRGGLEALEHAALTLRGLARSVLDSAGITSEASPVRDPQTALRLAGVLAKLGEAIRTYGHLVQLTPGGSDSLESQLAGQLGEAHRQQDELAELLRPRARSGGPSEWPLRGEILAHVDRLRTDLSVQSVRRAISPPRRQRHRPARRPWPAARSARLGPPGRLLRPARQLLHPAHELSGNAARSRSSAHRPR